MPRARRVRTRIFVACEGESEAAFRAWLQDLCDQQVLPLHLDGARLRGGDALALVRGALKRRQESQRKAGVGHRHSLLLIDTDRLDDGSPRSREASELAEAQGLLLIRQVPCFEGLLLRLHLDHEREFPPTAQEAQRRLGQLWPDYGKPMTRSQLAARFSLADLQRLAAVDGQIRRLVEILGLPQPK